MSCLTPLGHLRLRSYIKKPSSSNKNPKNIQWFLLQFINLFSTNYSINFGSDQLRYTTLDGNKLKYNGYSELLFIFVERYLVKLLYFIYWYFSPSAITIWSQTDKIGYPFIEQENIIYEYKLFEML